MITMDDEESLSALDAYGHQWDVGWMVSETPHPIFDDGQHKEIYGWYVPQCLKCGMYGEEFKQQKCGAKIRGMYGGVRTED